MPTRPEQVALFQERQDGNDVPLLEARLVVLTAFVGGILFELDREGCYLGVWTGEPELLARPADELLGRKVTEIIGAEMGARFIEIFNRVIDTRVPESFDYTLDVKAGRRNFRCEARPTPSPTPGEEAPETATLLVRDITQETELKAQLVDAERLAAMGLVAASIGHEIRQPLAFATTSVEILARELERNGGSERANEALAHVRDAIRRIGGIAASVGVVAPDHRRELTTDILHPIRAAIDLCASELRGRARITVDVVPDLPRVRLNEGELCQVLTNLLLNAAHAVDPARGDTNTISVTAVPLEGGSAIRISVVDDGCGIDPANVAHIFDPFFTTKEPGRGTGLGLFASRRLVEQAGGVLAIESLEGRGTAVHATLPVASEPVVAPAPPAISKRRLRVLVIDDEPSFLRSLKMLLEEMHEVVVCQQSHDALALLHADPLQFDAVLCDLSMPRIDGVAFYEHMEALGIARRFVLMTAGAFTPRGEAFLCRSTVQRIGKPFPLEGLLSVLDAVAPSS